ncbi:hypothetical protein HDR63_00415 [bacterium]|nr:hypothetical protein [bacterium]
MLEATLLTVDQIEGDNALDMIKVRGIGTICTDLAMLQGATLDKFIKIPICHTFTASYRYNPRGRVLCSVHDGVFNTVNPRDCGPVVRPALPPETTACLLNLDSLRTQYPDRKYIFFEYGTFPQRVMRDDEKAQFIQFTPIDGRCFTFAKQQFSPDRHQVYQSNGRKFISVVAQKNDSLVSNGHWTKKGDGYWVEILPIVWMLDLKTGWALSEAGLFSGIAFDDAKTYNGQFKKTFLYNFMQKYFVPEMSRENNVVSRIYPSFENANDNDQQTSETPKPSKIPAYGVTIERAPMSVREQMAFYVNNGQSFMLHGPSGVGKTDRVMAIDPDLTAVPLWNGVLPEDIVGKVIYPTGASLPLTTGRADGGNPFDGAPTVLTGGGQWVAPDWYNVLCRKCAATPDQKHILFIDEVTNARPTTQSLIFHIVLKGSIGPSHGPLPSNAVVVLAGNEQADSGAAYNMPAPLFRRMAGHIHLKLNMADWLEWGAERRRDGRPNLHPLVAGFVANNSNVFYSAYDEEKPQKWAVDPRGWAQVSDMIYANNNVLRSELLENKIGPENTAALIAFAHAPMITLDDIVSGTANPSMVPRTFEGQLAMAGGWTRATDDQVVKVRNFIEKYMLPEIRAVFDSMWAGNDINRLNQLRAAATAQFMRG